MHAAAVAGGVPVAACSRSQHPIGCGSVSTACGSGHRLSATTQQSLGNHSQAQSGTQQRRRWRPPHMLHEPHARRLAVALQGHRASMALAGARPCRLGSAGYLPPPRPQPPLPCLTRGTRRGLRRSIAACAKSSTGSHNEWWTALTGVGGPTTAFVTPGRQLSLAPLQQFGGQKTEIPHTKLLQLARVSHCWHASDQGPDVWLCSCAGADRSKKGVCCRLLATLLSKVKPLGHPMCGERASVGSGQGPPAAAATQASAAPSVRPPGARRLGPPRGGSCADRRAGLGPRARSPQVSRLSAGAPNAPAALSLRPYDPLQPKPAPQWLPGGFPFAWAPAMGRSASRNTARPEAPPRNTPRTNNRRWVSAGPTPCGGAAALSCCGECTLHAADTADSNIPQSIAYPDATLPMHPIPRKTAPQCTRMPCPKNTSPQKPLAGPAPTHAPANK
jgi:hypothetical protein